MIQKIGYIKFFSLLLVGLIAFILVVNNKKIRKENRNLSTDNKLTEKEVIEDKDVKVEIVGIVRFTGLLPEEKEKLKLKIGNYQFTDINSREFKQKFPDVKGFYLENEEVRLEYLLGKCTKLLVSKSEIERGIRLMKSIDVYSYERFPITNFKIERIDYDFCNPYSPADDKKIGKKRVFRGFLDRRERPAPDIAEDYVLKNLNEPIIDISSGFSTKLYEISVIPDNDEVWKRFEESIRKNIAVEGYLLQGYSETQYVLVERVIDNSL